MATATKKNEKSESVNEAPATPAMTGGDWAAEAVGEFKSAGAKRVNPDVFFYKFEVDGKVNPICGIVLEKRARKDRVGDHYYILGLTKPCVLFNGDKEKIEGKPGMFAWVDEKWCTQPLQNFLPIVTTDQRGVRVIQEVSEVMVIPTTKKPLAGGKSVWQAEVYAKGRGGKDLESLPLLAPKAKEPPPQLQEKNDDEDIPF